MNSSVLGLRGVYVLCKPFATVWPLICPLQPFVPRNPRKDCKGQGLQRARVAKGQQPFRQKGMVKTKQFEAQVKVGVADPFSPSKRSHFNKGDFAFPALCLVRTPFFLLEIVKETNHKKGITNPLQRLRTKQRAGNVKANLIFLGKGLGFQG